MNTGYIELRLWAKHQETLNAVRDEARSIAMRDPDFARSYSRVKLWQLEELPPIKQTIVGSWGQTTGNTVLYVAKVQICERLEAMYHCAEAMKQAARQHGVLCASFEAALDDCHVLSYLGLTEAEVAAFEFSDQSLVNEFVQIAIVSEYEHQDA